MDGGETTRDEVLRRDIPWETIMTSKMISGTGLQLLRRFDKKPKEVQATLLEEDGPAYIQTFMQVLRNVSKEDTAEYVLAMMDQLLTADPSRARFFHSPAVQTEEVYQVLLSSRPSATPAPLKERPNGASSSSSSSSEVTSAKGGVESVQAAFIDWICGQLRQPSHASRSAGLAVGALASLLRESSARSLLVKADGVKCLAPLISPASSQQYMQLLYEAVLCVWLLSFHEAAVEAIEHTRIAPRLVEVAKSSSKEKVVRVTVLALCGLHSKGSLGDAMVECGLPKVVTSLQMQAWGDEDLKTALDTLEADLRAKVKVLSSFDKYKQEVLSGSLEWTPMHKDPVFWRESAGRFEENDFQVLRVLITLVDNSRDPKTLAVACSDLGKFIENHPSGRNIALDLKAKDRVMGLMENSDPEVRKQALLCVQKLLLSAKYVSYIG